MRTWLRHSVTQLSPPEVALLHDRHRHRYRHPLVVGYTELLSCHIGWQTTGAASSDCLFRNSAAVIFVVSYSGRYSSSYILVGLGTAKALEAAISIIICFQNVSLASVKT
jgi:hypothetical protein